MLRTFKHHEQLPFFGDWLRGSMILLKQNEYNIVLANCDEDDDKGSFSGETTLFKIKDGAYVGYHLTERFVRIFTLGRQLSLLGQWMLNNTTGASMTTTKCWPLMLLHSCAKHNKKIAFCKWPYWWISMESKIVWQAGAASLESEKNWAIAKWLVFNQVPLRWRL